MRLPSPLVKAVLRRRYKRFLADVTLLDGPEEGREATAHIANPGAMTGLAEPGATVWLSKSADPKRKLAWSWELTDLGERGLVGVSTQHPNRVVEEALLARRIPALAAYGGLRREVRYGERSRVDFLLSEPGLPDAYVEVKNVHLSREAGWAEFPDAVTARGARHLGELARMVESGSRAVLLYLVQRQDCARFRLAADIDPAYAEASRRARVAGVETLAHACRIDLESIELAAAVPVESARIETAPDANAR